MTNKVFRVRHGLTVGNNDFVASGGKAAVNGAVGTHNFEVNGTGGMLVPVGNTSQRPTPTHGVIRYNFELNTFEGYANSVWGPLAATDVTSLAASVITSGTLAPARLPQANTTSNGAVILLDSVTNTSIAIYAPTANAVKTAYDVAISANTRAASAQTAAAAAYANAVADLVSPATLNNYLAKSGGVMTGDILPTSNSVSIGNSTNRFITWGAAATFSGSVTSATGFFPTSNTSGASLGGTTQRFNITGNTATFSGNINTSTSVTAQYVQATGASSYAIYGQTATAGSGGVIGYSQSGSYYGILGYSNAYVVYGAGHVYATLDGYFGQNVYAYYSDRRLKKDIVEIQGALEMVRKISGVYYRQNEVAEKHGYKNKDKQIGVIAQEIKKVIPEAIGLAPFDSEVDENGNIKSKSGENYMTVQLDKIVPVLIQAIKELDAKVKTLEARLGA